MGRRSQEPTGFARGPLGTCPGRHPEYLKQQPTAMPVFKPLSDRFGSVIYSRLILYRHSDVFQIGALPEQQMGSRPERNVHSSSYAGSHPGWVRELDVHERRVRREYPLHAEDLVPNLKMLVQRLGLRTKQSIPNGTTDDCDRRTSEIILLRNERAMVQWPLGQRRQLSSRIHMVSRNNSCRELVLTVSKNHIRSICHCGSDHIGDMIGNIVRVFLGQAIIQAVDPDYALQLPGNQVAGAQKAN